MENNEFYDEDDANVEFEGNIGFSGLISDEDEEDESSHLFCNKSCCKAKLDKINANDVTEKIFNFCFPQNDSLGIILEKHDTYLSKLKETDKRLQPIAPIKILNNPCKCGQRCDALLSIYEICRMRMNWPLAYRDRNAAQFILIKELIFEKTFIPYIKSYMVCIDFFCAVNLIPITRAKRFIELANEGVGSPVHPNTGRRFEHDTTIEKLARLAMYIEENFESNPSSNSFLPSSRITKCTAAGEALNIPKEKRRKCNFTKLFKKLACKTHFVAGNALTKCDICTAYSFKLKKISSSKDEKAKLSADWEAHRVQVRKRRLDYKFKGLLGYDKPNKYGSIVHDGMCKMRTKLPLNNDHRSKKVADNDRMFCGLNLAIMHRRNGKNNTTTVGFFSPGSCYDNTTNSIATQLLISLSTLPAVPPTIFIQLDNFPGNKSYVFFAIFSYILLRQTAIKEFYVSFMLPGHTHCDVDARFGNFSAYLNAKECGSPQELVEAFLECIPGQAILKQSIYNFKEVLIPQCFNYGKLKSMYDFHLYIDGTVPMVENIGFELSETLLCGQRNKDDTFTSKIFTNPPPLDLEFELVPPNISGIEKMESHIDKWKDVISPAAQEQLKTLKTEIQSHVGIYLCNLK